MRKARSLSTLVLAMSLLMSCGGGGGGGGDNGSSGSTLADLVVTSVSTLSSAVAGSTYTITGTITNQGGTMGAAAAVLYLSPNSNVTIDGGQVGLAVYMGFLGAGSSWNFSTSITIPENVSNGSYYFGVAAMGDDPSVQGNNVTSQPITIIGGTTCSSDGYEPDNAFSAATSLAFATPQQHNHCEGTSDWMRFTATGGTVYGVFAAKTGSEASPILSVYGTDGSTLLPSTPFGSSFYSRITWTAPADGTYYIKAAPWNGVSSGGANTEYDVTVGDLRPDLVVSSLLASASGLPGGILWASDTVRNQGFVSAGTFTVSLYLSADATVTNGDTLLGSRTVGSLGVDESNYSSTEYTIPAGVTPGQYYLAAIANPQGSLNEFIVSNNTGTVLSFTVQSLGTCTPDGYEEDDTALSTATTITAGDAAQAHNHCDDTEDWIKLPMTSGSSYAIRVARSNLSTAWVELYDTNGTTKLAGNGTTAIDHTAAATDTYYLKIGNCGSAGDGRDYTVQVQPQLADLVQTLTLSNGTTVPAGGFLNVTDMVSNVGYLDAGAFEIGFYYSANSPLTTGDSLGATRALTGLPSSGYLSSNQSWANYVHFPKGVAPGTYYLAAIADRTNAVAEVNEANNGSQSLAITVTAPSCSWDAYEDDDTAASAQSIAPGETQNRNFCDDGIDWIKFTPSVNGVYVAYSPTEPAYLTVYQQDGITPVTPHDTYFYSKVSWDATAGTPYLLKYATYQGALGGAYQFGLFQCSQDAYEDDDVLAAAKPIAVNETQTRNHCEDRYDWAKFDAVAGTSYTITTTNGQNVYLTLYDGVSPYAVASSSTAQGGKLRVINWTAPTSGTYYIEMDRFEFGQNTDYTLNLK